MSVTYRLAEEDAKISNRILQVIEIQESEVSYLAKAPSANASIKKAPVYCPRQRGERRRLWVLSAPFSSFPCQNSFVPAGKKGVGGVTPLIIIIIPLLAKHKP